MRRSAAALGGMNPTQALTAATTNGAALLGLDNLGTIATSKEGTLLALEGDPLTDITAVQRVCAIVKAGQVVKRPSAATGRPERSAR